MNLVRRYFTSGLITLLCLMAALAIYVLITGEIGWTELKALFTALICFGAGLNAVACLACKHEVPHPSLVWFGVAAGCLTGGLLLALLWFDIQLMSYWRLTGVTLIWTLVYTHCLVPSLIRVMGWQGRLLVPLARLSSLCLGILLTYGLLTSNYESWMIRTASVLTILVGFFTLLLVILQRKLKAPEIRLVLKRCADGRYVDAAGLHYQVHRED